MSTCPNGHSSTATDYCDTCGSPMVAASAPPPWAGSSGAGSGGSGGAGTSGAGGAGTSGAGGDPSGEAAEPGSRVCPNCGATSGPAHLFCEDCGYDFTTGALPRPLTEGLAAVDTRVPAPAATGSASAPEATPAGAPVVPSAPDQAAAARPEVESAPEPTSAAPPEVESAPQPTPAAAPDQPLMTSAKGATAPKAQVTNGHSIGSSGTEPARAADPEPAPAAPAPAPAPAAPSAPQPLDPPSAPATGARPTNQAPSRRAVGDWVVEVWIDPAWYEVQSSDEACPSPAVPDIVRISGRALVGRHSASRRIAPDVDCGADSGVSRRHAEFTTDGRRWWVEDLGSSNGTYVGPASGPLPNDPIPAGQRVEIDDDDRIYVGAWTRLVLRRATDSEVAGTG